MRSDMQRPALSMTLVLALATGACQSRNTGAAGTESAARTDTSTSAESAAAPVDSGVMSKSSDSTKAAKGLTDATILGMLDGANKADSTGGALASKQATDPEVKAFAKMMMTDHHALRVAGEDLAQKLGITPTPPAKDPVAGYVAAENAALRKAKKGADFDRTYIDNEVTVHQAVLDAANMAKVSASSQELKDLIAKAGPVIQKHLDEAQAIQKKLNSTT